MSAASAARDGPKSGGVLPPGLFLTDLYQLNKVQAYVDRDMTEPAVFELFVRNLPETRGFLIAAGLEQALDFLATARFTETELDWLRQSGRFNADMPDYLAALRFTGDVDALPEGTVFFQDEPILRVIAPLPIAQLIETPARLPGIVRLSIDPYGNLVEMPASLRPGPHLRGTVLLYLGGDQWTETVAPGSRCRATDIDPA